MIPILRHKWFGSYGTGLLRMLSLVCLGLVLIGCPASKTEKIVIRGSNTLGEELIPRLAAEYQKEHRQATFDLEFKGTLYGFGELMAGQCDIAAASRGANMNELALARDRGAELSDSVIGSYAVEVIVNAGNPVTNMTPAQVRDIFSGVVQNWKEVGGPDAPVHLFIRDPISGTYLGFRELAMENKPYGLNVKTFTNYAGIVQAVAKDPGGIGYSSFGLDKKAGAKAISIGGVAPAVFLVNRGDYPYTRVLRLLTNKAKVSPAAQDFIGFVVSPRGQAIVEQLGDVPRP
jgi:phosphate transport system substrate-binding protein